MFSRAIASVTLGLLLPACNEKPPAQAKHTDTSSDPTDDIDDGDPTGTGSGTGSATGTAQPGGGFDLCRDGLQVAPITEAAPLVTLLCSQLTSLRSDGHYYSGGETAAIFEDSVAVGDTQTSFRLLSSGRYNARAPEYWAMVQLQFKKPDIYKQNFDYDHLITFQEDQVLPDQVSYLYTYDDGQGGRIAYKATTRFVTLRDSQAWVAVTSTAPPDASFDKVQAISGLIVVNRLSDTSTEVFTASAQSYAHPSGQGATLKGNAVNKLTYDQTHRSVNNAAKCNLAPGLLGG